MRAPHCTLALDPTIVNSGPAVLTPCQGAPHDRSPVRPSSPAAGGFLWLQLLTVQIFRSSSPTAFAFF